MSNLSDLKEKNNIQFNHNILTSDSEHFHSELELIAINTKTDETIVTETYLIGNGTIANDVQKAQRKFYDLVERHLTNNSYQTINDNYNI